MLEYKKQIATGALIAATIVLILAGGSNYYFAQTTSTSTITIITDKTSYVVGSTIKWTASGLTKGKSYIVGADINQSVYHSDSFIATASTMTGSYAAGSNVVAATSFIIGQVTSSSAIEILASAPITVSR